MKRITSILIAIVALATFSNVSAATGGTDIAAYQHTSQDIFYMVGVTDAGSDIFADYAVTSSSDDAVEDAFDSVGLQVVQSQHLSASEAADLNVSEAVLYQIRSDSGDGFMWQVSKGDTFYQFVGIGDDLDTEEFAAFIVSVLIRGEVPTVTPAGFINVTPKG